MSVTVAHIVDARRHPLPSDIYIGRPSRYGNPFSIGKDGTRAEVIEKFRQWFYADAQLELRRVALLELQDKRLVCFCWPEPCHGDVIAEYVNS